MTETNPHWLSHKGNLCTKWKVRCSNAALSHPSWRLALFSCVFFLQWSLVPASQGKKPTLSHQFQQEQSPLGSQWPVGASPLWLGKGLLSSAGFVSSPPPTVGGDQPQGLSGRGYDSPRKRGACDDKGGENDKFSCDPSPGKKTSHPSFWWRHTSST